MISVKNHLCRKPPSETPIWNVVLFASSTASTPPVGKTPVQLPWPSFKTISNTSVPPEDPGSVTEELFVTKNRGEDVALAEHSAIEMVRLSAVGIVNKGGFGIEVALKLDTESIFNVDC